jgi:hypothetical protein
MPVQIKLSSRLLLLLLPKGTPVEPVTAQSLGFELDPQEMADELSAPLPAGFSSDNLPEVAPEDFERLYGWFLS